MRNINSTDRLIAYDIETRADDRTDEYINTRKDYEAPSNYKRQEAIDSYIDKAREKDRGKAALYVPTQNVWVICAEHVATGERVHFESKEEKVVVEEFFEYLDAYPRHTIFGFNTRSFDVPCLYGAALRCNLQVPAQLRDATLQSDILDDFYHTKLKLQDLAFCIGQSKTMEGSEVGQAWLDYVMDNNTDARDRIIDYCKQDVHLCAEYVRRVYT